MPATTGLHHVSLPAADVVRQSGWHERVPGLRALLMAEDQDVVTMIVMEHQYRVLLYRRLARHGGHR